MDIQELLTPRWKVVSPWPFMPYHIDELLTVSENGKSFYAIETQETSAWQPVEALDTYGQIIRKLKWYEDRSPEDMPEYVRFGEFHRRHAIYKIKEWHLQGIYGIDTVCAIAESPVDYLLRFGVDNCYPAAEADYLTYINQKP